HWARGCSWPGCQQCHPPSFFPGPISMIDESGSPGANTRVWWLVARPDFLEAPMGKRLYVGNLTYGSTDATLRQLFEAHGTATSAQIIMDRDTGRSKGFGFVEMGSDAEAQAAIAALNGKEVDGRALTVNEARPKSEGGGGGRSKSFSVKDL